MTKRGLAPKRAKQRFLEHYPESICWSCYQTIFIKKQVPGAGAGAVPGEAELTAINGNNPLLSNK